MYFHYSHITEGHFNHVNNSSMTLYLSFHHIWWHSYLRNSDDVLLIRHFTPFCHLWIRTKNFQSMYKLYYFKLLLKWFSENIKVHQVLLKLLGYITDKRMYHHKTERRIVFEVNNWSVTDVIEKASASIYPTMFCSTEAGILKKQSQPLPFKWLHWCKCKQSDCFQKEDVDHITGFSVKALDLQQFYGIDSPVESMDAWGCASIHRCYNFCAVSVSIQNQQTHIPLKKLTCALKADKDKVLAIFLGHFTSVLTWFRLTRGFFSH